MFSMRQLGRQALSRSAPRSLSGGGPKKILLNVPEKKGGAASLSSLSCPFETYATTTPVHDEADWRIRTKKFTHAALMAEEANSTPPRETPADDAASSWRVRSLKFTYPALMMAEAVSTRPETTSAAAAQELPFQAGPARFDHEKTAAADWRMRSSKFTHAALTMAEQANSTPPQEKTADDTASSWRVRSLKFTYPALMAEATPEENQRAAGSVEEPSFLIHQEDAQQILLLIAKEEGDLARQ